MPPKDLPPAAPRQLPLLEPVSAFYWLAGEHGALQIQRCICGHYQHPPLPLCPRCGSEDLAPTPVSGRGRVATFTVNHQPWRPGLPVPYVIAATELAEQAQLYVYSNIVGCTPDAVHIGMEVEVLFEQIADIWLPQFRPVEAKA